MQIKVKPEYKALIPEPSEKNFAATEESILRNGLYEEIVINKDGYILDGHTRYKICQLHNIEPRFTEKKFPNELEEILYIISTNIMRRHLNPVQRSLIALKLKPIFEEIAEKNRRANLKQGTKKSPTVPFGTLGRVNEAVAKSAGVSKNTIIRVETLQREASPELLEEAIKTGKADRAMNTHRREQNRKKLLEEAKQSKELPEGISLIQGDFRIVGQSIKDNSVDHIYCDPLYFKKSLDDYSDLAILAFRVLKPGGSIVFYVGTAIIPQVIDHFRNAGLEYHWMLSVNLQGPFARAHDGKVRITYKPLLWFRKGDKVKINYENS